MSAPVSAAVTAARLRDGYKPYRRILYRDALVWGVLPGFIVLALPAVVWLIVQVNR